MFWTHQEARKLLRLLRRPHALERERLAVLLRQATQAQDARSALLAVVENAFDPGNPADKLRFEIIKRCDIGGETTRAAAAALNLSVRQFFRHRADAIGAIAQTMERMLRRPPDSQSHLLQLAQAVEAIDPKAALDIYQRVLRQRGGEVSYKIVRAAVWAGIDVTQEQINACEGSWRLHALAAQARHLVAQGENERAAAIRDELRSLVRAGDEPGYSAVAFELAFQDRCEACRTGDVAECRRHLERMRSLAGQHEELVALALLAEADQALLEGDWTAASISLDDVEVLDVHARDLNIMARTALQKGMLSLVRGFHEEAFALANGAGQAIAALEGAVALRASSMAGRAALFCGTRWNPPLHLFERYPNVWTKSASQAVLARHLLRSDPQAAKVAAESAILLAVRHHSSVQASYARVSLAGALDQLGDPQQAQALRLAAWTWGIRNRDQFARYDLFYNPHAPSHDIGCMKLDAQFMAELHRYLLDQVSAYATLVEGSRGSRDALSALQKSVRAALDVTAKGEQPGSLRVKQHAAEADNQIVTSVANVAARAVSVCLAPKDREQFEELFRRMWEAHSATLVSSEYIARAG